MPRKPKPPIPCGICAEPAVDFLNKDLPLCPECAAIARDIANQRADELLKSIRRLKAEYREQEIAA